MALEQNDKTFQFELVSPECVVVSEKAIMVVIPGEEGNFGVLAEHSPLLSSVRAGVVSVHTPAEGIKRIFVSGGFADVSSELCSVLVEEAVSVSDLDTDKVKKEINELEIKLDNAKSVEETADLRKKIAVAKAKMEFAS